MTTTNEPGQESLVEDHVDGENSYMIRERKKTVSNSPTKKKRTSLFRRKIDNAVKNINELVLKSFASDASRDAAHESDIKDRHLKESPDAYVRDAYHHAQNFLIKGSDIVSKCEALRGLGQAAWLGGTQCQETVGQAYLRSLTQNATSLQLPIRISALQAICAVCVCHEKNKTLARYVGLICLCANNVNNKITCISQWPCHLLFLLCCGNTDNQKYLVNYKSNIKDLLLNLSRQDWGPRKINDATQILLMIDHTMVDEDRHTDSIQKPSK